MSDPQFDPNQLMAQARELSEKVQRMQQELKLRTVEATVGGGMVTVRVNGGLELEAIQIDPQAVDPRDVEMLQDLIVSAVNQAMRRAGELAQQEMQRPDDWCIGKGAHRLGEFKTILDLFPGHSRDADSDRVLLLNKFLKRIAVLGRDGFVDDGNIDAILGALGVFLFGMKIMSEALQKVAGATLKNLLNKITSNRVSGVITGFMVTAIVQSSSATTVMVVSFVGAGLLTLTGGISVIMGANIGTTVTGWLVALLGFKVKLTIFALPAVGVGMALMFGRGAKAKQLGEALLGFGLLFLGLALMKEAVPSVSGDQLGWVAGFSSYGILSTILFVVVGSVLTVILQSSSATMTLTLTLTAAGLIPYEAAAAMILGENIGTK